jgi:hypothetical protein
MVIRIVLAVALGFLALATASGAAGPTVDTITVKWRADVDASVATAMPDDVRNAIYNALQTQFVQVGSTADDAFELQLTQPLSLDVARAALNRVRMLPQVLYASLGDTGTQAVVNRGLTAASGITQQPPIRRMIVKYRDPAITAGAQRNQPLPPQLVNALAAKAGQQVAPERAMAGGAYVVRLFQALPADQAQSLAGFLRTDASIEYALPDLLKQPSLVPNDPSYSSQWHYQSPPTESGGANLPPAWTITTGSSNVVVAVIDTGILPHPDLVGRYLGGYDMISDALVANDSDGRDSDPTDPGDWITTSENHSGYFQGCPVANSSWHGTHVSGTIGAATNNNTGVAGINWVSSILPVRVLGKCGGYTRPISSTPWYGPSGDRFPASRRIPLPLGC